MYYHSDSKASMCARVVIFYEAADGRIRMCDRYAAPHRGNENWSAQEWMSHVCATAFVRQQWRRIEVTREGAWDQSWLRKAYVREEEAAAA